MRERQAARVQELALEAELARASVDRVTRNREVDRRQVHADLVGAAGFELDLEERVTREQLDELEVRHRVARSVRIERVPQGVAAVAADRGFDAPAARPRPADHEREVAPLERAAADESL